MEQEIQPGESNQPDQFDSGALHKALINFRANTYLATLFRQSSLPLKRILGKLENLMSY